MLCPSCLKLKKAICILFLSTLVLSASASASEIQAVALSGDQPVGVSTGAAYRSFYQPVLNDIGEVAFSAEMQPGIGGVVYADALGVWAGSPSQLRLVARSGAPAPGTPTGTNFRHMQSILINDSGDVAFEGWLGTRIQPRGVAVTAAFTESATLDSSNDFGVWIENAGALKLVLREGDGATVGDADFTFLNLGSTSRNASYDTGPHLVLSNNGQVAFAAELTSGAPKPPFRFAVVVGDANSVSILATSGQEAPGTNGGSFSYFSITPVISQSGAIAFHASWKPASGSDVNVGVWKLRNGALELVAQSGVPNIDPNGGPAFIPSYLSVPVINRDSDLAFMALLPDLQRAICAERNGILQVIAREDSMSGDPPAETMFQKLMPPVINDAGAVAFRASSLKGAEAWAAPNDSGIWLSTNDGLRLVAREGERAPGTSDGVVFDEFIISGPYGGGYLEWGNWIDPVVNARGQVAFFAGLRGADIGFRRSIGLWAEDVHGELKLIAATGHALEVSPGDFRIVDELTAGIPVPGYAIEGVGRTGNGDGRPSVFNDLGQIVFSATFTDGSSGVFISNVAAVPEPSSAILLIVCVCLRMVSSEDEVRRRKGDRIHF